jgi:hypothetical protein
VPFTENRSFAQTEYAAALRAAAAGIHNHPHHLAGAILLNAPVAAVGARAFVAPRAASHGVPAPDYRFSGFRELAS